MSKNEGLSLAKKPVYEYAIDPDIGLETILKELGFEGLSDDERLNVIDQASIDDYIIAADIVHHKVAPDENQEFHNGSVKIVDPATNEVRHLTAKPAERVIIMGHALEKAHRLIGSYKEKGGDVKDVLNRCGNLAAFGVLLAHSWEEGNGRTARTLAELIKTGYDSSNEENVSDLKVLSSNRPNEGFRINSYVPIGEWADRANDDPLAFLDQVAAQSIPFDGNRYAEATRHVFSTPRG